MCELCQSCHGLSFFEKRSSRRSKRQEGAAAGPRGVSRLLLSLWLNCSGCLSDGGETVRPSPLPMKKAGPTDPPSLLLSHVIQRVVLVLRLWSSSEDVHNDGPRHDVTLRERGKG